jgi:ATP-dependent helicase HrpA
VGLERVTLYGLPIVTARKVDYGRVDPAVARELFILHALLAGEWETHNVFPVHNAQLVEDVEALEDRVRRRDLLVDDEALFDFYDRRIPEDITSVRHFDRWWRQEQERHPDLLHFTPEMLVRPEAGEVSATDYPDTWPEGDLGLVLSYEFEPGSDTDGVTVHIPLPVLQRANDHRFDWQVPGRRQELVTALIRSLPKDLRRRFVPVADYVEAFLERATPEDGPLPEVLAAELTRMTGEPVPPDAWQLERLPDHLRMTFRVTDEAGGTLALGKDLDVLQSELQGRIRTEIARAARAVEHPGMRTWSCGTLARVVDVGWGGHPVRLYPALVDEGDSVAVRVCTTEAEQEEEMWVGTGRLLLLTVPSPVAAARRLLPEETKLTLARSPYGTAAELFDDCVDAAAVQLVADHGGPVWDEEGFQALLSAAGTGLVDTVVYVATVVGGILAMARGIETRLAGVTAPQLQEAVTDMRAQLSGLVHPGFVTATGTRRLADVLRYLQAMERRLDKLAQDPARDRELMRRVQRLEERYEQLRAQGSEHVRWMIEELRVSFFAQTLGTAHPVSEKRILREIERQYPE